MLQLQVKKNDTSIKFKEHKWLFIASVKYLGCPEQWVDFLLCTFSMFYFSSMTRETFNYSDSTIQLYFFTLILVAHMDHDSGTSVCMWYFIQYRILRGTELSHFSYSKIIIHIISRIDICRRRVRRVPARYGMHSIRIAMIYFSQCESI